MAGLKKYHNDFRTAGNRVTPDEIDSYRQYFVVNAGTSPTALGTVAPGTVAGTFIVTNFTLDYPRNLLFSVLGPVGGVGGTAVFTGKNQFGVTITESLTVGSANAGGSVAGTKIFSQISAGTYSPNGVNNLGTPRVGYAVGTAANLVFLFGLPDKILATGDVKSLTWINNGTSTAVNNGTIAAYINAGTTSSHSFTGTSPLVNTDIYQVLYKTSYNLENEGYQANL